MLPNFLPLKHFLYDIYSNTQAKIEATRVDKKLMEKKFERNADVKPPPKEFWEEHKRMVLSTC